MTPRRKIGELVQLIGTNSGASSKATGHAIVNVSPRDAKHTMTASGCDWRRWRMRQNNSGPPPRPPEFIFTTRRPSGRRLHEHGRYERRFEKRCEPTD